MIAFVTLDFRQTLFADTRDSLRQAHILRLEGVRCMLSEADPGAGAAAFSDEMGVRKPAAEIFHRVLDQTGVGPAVAVHVGDDPVTDVAGARGVGMRAIHYVPDPSVTAAPADGALPCFVELPGLVARLP